MNAKNHFNRKYSHLYSKLPFNSLITNIQMVTYPEQYMIGLFSVDLQWKHMVQSVSGAAFRFFGSDELALLAAELFWARLLLLTIISVC